MCTSPNGWSWQVPADPTIFATDGAALFSPLSVAHSPDGDHVVNAAEGVWYSLDGVHWKPSPAPAESNGFRAVIYAAGVFTLVGDDANGSPLYVSPDGGTWTAAGRVPSVFALVRGDTSGGLVTQTSQTPKGGVGYVYSADGRTWVTAALPKNEWASIGPYRLSDGSLIMRGDAIMRSTDGRSWVALKTGWAPNSMAIAGDRIVAVVNGSGGVGTAWESSDDGRTFHKLMDGAAGVAQFGDLVLLGTSNGGAYVGTPLSPSEGPGTTPTATGLPGSSAVPAYTPQPTPLGGISRDEAIRIATNAVHPTADELAKATAGVELDSRYGRWIWTVSFNRDSGGSMAPSSTGGSGTFVDIDFYTGAVLASGEWVS